MSTATKRQRNSNHDDTATIDNSINNDTWYRPHDLVSPFVLGVLSTQPDTINQQHLAVISQHYCEAERETAEQDVRVQRFKSHFAVNYQSQCAQRLRYWHVMALHFSDFSLPKIPDLPSGTVGCYERHLKDSNNLVGVARAIWEYALPRCPHGVQIVLCPPSPLAEVASVLEGSFYAYLSPDNNVISESEPVGYLCILTF